MVKTRTFWKLLTYSPKFGRALKRIALSSQLSPVCGNVFSKERRDPAECFDDSFCQQTFENKNFVDITQQCLALLLQVNFTANNLNFH